MKFTIIYSIDKYNEKHCKIYHITHPNNTILYVSKDVTNLIVNKFYKLFELIFSNFWHIIC